MMRRLAQISLVTTTVLLAIQLGAFADDPATPTPSPTPMLTSRARCNVAAPLALATDMIYKRARALAREINLENPNSPVIRINSVQMTPLSSSQNSPILTIPLDDQTLRRNGSAIIMDADFFPLNGCQRAYRVRLFYKEGPILKNTILKNIFLVNGVYGPL